MAVDVIGEAFHQIEGDFPLSTETETESKSYSIEPTLALIDYSDGIWLSDSFTSICAAIKDRYIKTNKRLEKFTSADILACIKFENTADDDDKRKQKKNRRVRFSTGMSISVDSLVQCNNDHQADSKEDGEPNGSTNITERQFLEAEYVTVPPHRHLATGENEIYSAYLEDIKTVGYGRRCLNIYPFYNNSFDPRLRFHGLQGEVNIATPVTEFGDHKYTDMFNCALNLQDPADFANSYHNSYRTYLKKLDIVVCVPKKPDNEAEESESSINLQEAQGVTETENRLLEKLEAVKYLWHSDEKALSSPSVRKIRKADSSPIVRNIETQLELANKAGEIGFNNDIKVEGISKVLYGLRSGLTADTAPLTSVPKVQQEAVKLKANEKFIVHTTCLRSDGQSTETLIHETILKTPSSAACVKRTGHDVPNDTVLQQIIGDRIREGSAKDTNHGYGDKQARNIEKSPEEYEDDSDATLTPGEEDSETSSADSPDKDKLKESRMIYRQGQFRQLESDTNSDNTDVAGTRQSYIPVLSSTTVSNRRLLPVEEFSREPMTELNLEPRRQTKLRATTEPFIPTSQRHQAHLDEEHNMFNVETVPDADAAAKQTTAPTSNEPIYQTSDTCQRSTPQKVTAEDVSTQPPLLWYSYQFPYQRSAADNHQVQQPSHCQMEVRQSHQEFQQQRYHLQPQTREQQITKPHGMKPDAQLQLHQQPNYSVRGNSAHVPQNLPQDHKAQHFTPHVHPQYYHHYPHKMGQGHHIPVQTSTRKHCPGYKHQRPFLHNHTGNSQAHSGNQYRRQTNSLQGQPSNQQPVYNSFWLQFQNTNNLNLQHGVPIHQPQHNIVPNAIPSGPSVRQGVPQRYDFVPQTEANRRPVAPDLINQSDVQQLDSQYITQQNSYAHKQQFKQSTEGQEKNMTGTRFPAHVTPKNPLIPVEPHINTTRIFDANANNNATTSEEEENGDCNLTLVKDKLGEVKSCIIDVLESSRSREKYRALKKPCKKLRPIRSCLVQVV